nr:cytochrome P450 [uncultured bacterium]
MSVTDLMQSDLNPFASECRADPYPRYHAIRELGPIVPGPPRIWILTGYAACATVLQDNRFGHLEPGEEPANPMFGRLGDDHELLTEPDGTPVPSFIAQNPPAHTRIRRLVGKAFTARMVQALEPQITGIVDGLLDEALAADEFDLLTALAYPLPITVISRLLGVPAGDYETFAGWSNDLVRGLDPLLMQDPEVVKRLGEARTEFNAYFRHLAAERRRRPGDDLLSAMASVSEGGDQLTETELVATCTLLLIAGHETTANMIGNGTLALLRNPGELAKLRDRPELAGRAVDELLRYDPPGQLAARIAREDVEVGGIAMQRGDTALTFLGAANRDPAVFTDPDRLDLNRHEARHLSFGHGIHFCLGALLAQLEINIALRALVRRAPGLRLAGELRYKDNVALRGLEELRVAVR